MIWGQGRTLEGMASLEGEGMESRHRWNPGVGLSQEAEWEGGVEAEFIWEV